MQPFASVLDYGAVGDGVADDSAAIQRAIDANPGGRVFLPKRSGLVAQANPSFDYYCGSTLRVRGYGTTLEGASGGYFGGTTLKFPAGVSGVDMAAADGANPTLRDLSLFGSEPSFSGTTPALQRVPAACGHGPDPAFGLDGLPAGVAGSTADGVRVGQVNPRLVNVWVHQFGRHGFNLVQDAAHLTDCHLLLDCGAVECRGHGLAVAGGDSNAGSALNCSFVGNQFWGVLDNSFLGNTYQGGQTATNGVDASAPSGWAPVAVTGAVRAGGAVTVTTGAPHGFAPGDYVSTGAFADWTFNSGVYRVVSSVPTPTSFTYGQDFPDGTAGPGQASRQPVPVASLARSSGTVTLTPAHPHGLSAGDVFAVRGTGGPFDGLFVAAAVTASAVSYRQAGPDASSAGGTVALYPAAGRSAVARCTRDGSGLATADLGGPHPWGPGQMMWLLGAGDASLDGPALVLRSDASSVTFAREGPPLAAGGGTLSLLRSGDGGAWIPGCGGGPFRGDTPGGVGSVFLGCYSEGDQGPSRLGPGNLVIGGDHGAGLDPDLRPSTVFTSGSGYQQLTTSYPVHHNRLDQAGIVHYVSGRTADQPTYVQYEGHDPTAAAANTYFGLAVDRSAYRVYSGIPVNTYGTVGTVQLTVNASGVLFGPGGLSPAATAGFPYVPTVRGTPTGVPDPHPGYAPGVVDEASGRLWFHSGGGWRAAGTRPVRFADASAPADSLYVSTATGRLTYKDQAGSVHPLHA